MDSKLALGKGLLCQPQVKYIGHIVPGKGIATDPAKIAAFATWDHTTDLKEF